MFFRDKKNPTKSEELLSAYASANPKDSDYVQMCLAQIAFAKDGACTSHSYTAPAEPRRGMHLSDTSPQTPRELPPPCLASPPCSTGQRSSPRW